MPTGMGAAGFSVSCDFCCSVTTGCFADCSPISGGCSFATPPPSDGASSWGCPSCARPASADCQLGEAHDGGGVKPLNPPGWIGCTGAGGGGMPPPPPGGGGGNWPGGSGCPGTPGAGTNVPG